MNYIQWLKDQTGRDDVIGDLARDVERDMCLPKHIVTSASLKKHILHSHHDACNEMFDALTKSRIEYYNRKV